MQFEFFAFASTITFNSPPSGGFLFLVSPSRDLPSVARARRARPRTKTNGRPYARKPTYREDRLAVDRGKDRGPLVLGTADPDRLHDFIGLGCLCSQGQ